MSLQWTSWPSRAPFPSAVRPMTPRWAATMTLPLLFPMTVFRVLPHLGAGRNVGRTNSVSFRTTGEHRTGFKCWGMKAAPGRTCVSIQPSAAHVCPWPVTVPVSQFRTLMTPTYYSLLSPSPECHPGPTPWFCTLHRPLLQLR